MPLCTSGVTEGLNTRIKLIIRQSYGFKNFDLMKEKLLACLFEELERSGNYLNKQCLSPYWRESQMVITLEIVNSDGTTETIVKNVKEGSKIYLSVNDEIITAQIITETAYPTIAKEQV